jgi:myo-inositol 2-dehydrogenase/D-chiro-inositol 1-dehydrogenase
VTAAALHVGLVGVGRIGSFHARTLASLDGVATLTVADQDRARAEHLAEELGVEAAATPAALVESGIDALVVATTTAGHAPWLRVAARAGIAAFCEKPVALDVATLDAAIDEVERAGILVQVGFQRRFDDGYRAAREAVARGRLGTLLVLRAATHDATPPAEEYVAASGGIFRDLHIHDFDAVHFVTGEDVVEVYAAGAVREAPWFAQHDDVDAAAAVLRLAGGALVVLTGTRHDPLGYDVRLELFGTRDSVAVGVDPRTPLRSLEPTAPAAQPDGSPYRDFMDRFEPAYRRELEVFVESVRTGGESACPLADARAALAVALAADRSRAERRPVQVAEASGKTSAGG